MALNGFSLIAQRYSGMSAVEKRIADCILADPAAAVDATVVYLAAKAKVSEGSVMKFSGSLGFTGFSQMKINLAQNLGSYARREDVSGADTPEAVLRGLMRDAASSFSRTADTAGDALRRAAEALLASDQILVTGIAFSSYVAEDLSARMLRIGLPARCECDPLVSCIAAAQLTERSVLFAVSHSGRTKNLLGCAKTARESGACVIGLTSYADSPLAKESDISLVAVSMEAENYREAATARLTQLLLGDSLIAFLTAKIGDEAVVRLDKMVGIFEHNREALAEQ
ncbi:MAG: MurR/RpiR family transcriptional regulator [Oscillospiraceae bacterium]|nr:MurR/RpiR family transcriptional regulator [Oscillospiraceae bacterium]